MSVTLNEWIAWLWRTSGQAAVVVVAVLAVQWLCCRGGARRWRAALWAVVLLRVIVPATPASGVSLAGAVEWGAGWWRARQVAPGVDLPAERLVAGGLVVRSGVLPAEGGPVVVTGMARRAPGLNPWAAVWAAGCVAMLVGVVTAHVRFRRRLAGAARVDDPELLALVRRCSGEMGVRAAPDVWVTDAVSSPALAGLVTPRLLMPAGGAELSAAQSRWVILHELAHLKRCDLWVDLSCDVLLAVHWFNPLLWVARARYRADREIARDEMVLRRVGGGDAAGYGQTIVALLERAAGARRSFGAVEMLEGRRAGIRRRLRNVASYGPRGVGSTVVGIGAMVLLGCASLTGPGKPAAVGSRGGVGGATTEGWTAGTVSEAWPSRPRPAVLDQIVPELRREAVPLSEVIDHLRNVTGAHITVNWKQLEQAGVPRGEPVTLRVRNMTLAKVLDVVTADVSGASGERVRWAAVNDQLIEITTASEVAQLTMGTIAYDVRDLLVPVDDAVPQARGTGGGAATAPTTAPAAGEAPMTHEQRVDAVVRLVRETVDPESWRTYGRIKELSGQLIVTQSEENHRTLRALLDQLRETRGIQVMLETRLVVLTPASLARLDGRLRAQGVTGMARMRDQALGTVFDAARAKAVLAAMAAEPEVRTITSPRLMLFNGQRGYVMVATQVAYVSGVTGGVDGAGRATYTSTVDVAESGVTIDAQATVSAKRDFVTCTLRPEITRLDRLEPVKGEGAAAPGKPVVQRPVVVTRRLHSTVSVPDGGMVILGGFADEWSGWEPGMKGASAPSTRPDAPAMVKDLFDGVAADDVYLLVTPRVVDARRR